MNLSQIPETFFNVNLSQFLIETFFLMRICSNFFYPMETFFSREFVQIFFLHFLRLNLSHLFLAFTPKTINNMATSAFVLFSLNFLHLPNLLPSTTKYLFPYFSHTHIFFRLLQLVPFAKTGCSLNLCKVV